MDADDPLEQLQAGVRFGPRMFEEMTELRHVAIAEIERLRARVTEIDRSTAATGYLVRTVIEPLGPEIEPAPDLMGVCTQVAHIAVALGVRADAAERERDALRAALEAIASGASPAGAGRDDLEVARGTARRALAGRVG